VNHRKIDFWPYTVVECEEAEKHLNMMYRKGYELIGISKGISLAGYIKVDNSAKEKNYSVVINDVKDFVEDDNLIYMDKLEGMSVYCTEEKTYNYNKEEAFTNLKSNLLRKSIKGSKHIWVYYLCIIMWVVILYLSFIKGHSGSGFDEYPRQIFNVIIWILISVSWLAQARRNKKNVPILKEYTLFENFKNGENGLYRKRLKVMSYVCVGVLLFPIALSIWFEIINENPGIDLSSIIMIMGMLMISFALFFTLIKRDYISTKGLTILGTLIIYLGLMYGSPY
jgi:hypothetical protein